MTEMNTNITSKQSYNNKGTPSGLKTERYATSTGIRGLTEEMSDHKSILQQGKAPNGLKTEREVTCIENMRGSTQEQIRKANKADHLKFYFDEKTQLNWIYTTQSKQEENINTLANRLVETNDELTIIIQRDTEGTKKENAVLKNKQELEELTKNDHHIYEIIPEHLPRCFFMDIDIKKEDLTAEEKQEIKKPKNLIDDPIRRMNKVFHMRMNPCFIEILQSKPSTKKLRYHIIFG